MPRPIIIDTDPGQDDAIAILLALASPELEVRGITTVSGNVPLQLTSRNARLVCELAGRTKARVFAGADRPLLRKPVTAEHVHGRTGLDGADLPEPSMPLDPQHAVDFIIESAMAAEPGSLSLCALAPLTNIAMALIREPCIAGRLREIVLMGGGYFEQGNITASAEFNIHVDPEAAAVVFASAVPITMIPLDCTHKNLTARSRVVAISELGTPVARAVVGWLNFFERFDVAKYGSDGGPLHDPLVIAWLLWPELFAGRHANVRIETVSELTLGATVVDWWGVTGLPANAMVLRDVDADLFYAGLTERLARL